MENIFENAKFGDKFKTKDGRCAILVNWGQWREKAYLYVEEKDIEFFGEDEYNLDGSVIKGNHSHDIIGKWEEPIPFNYNDVCEQSDKQYPKDVFNRYAFKGGVEWAVEQIYKNKTREDIINEMGIPTATMD